MQILRRRLNYANVTATLALVFAMSGGALAANHYLINSTKQIGPKVFKALKGKTGATGPAGTAGPTGGMGQEGAAGKEGKEGAAGKEGKEGKAGEEGKEGPPGPVNLSKLEKVEGPFEKPVFVLLVNLAVSEAICPAGSHAISGGDEIEENPKATSVTNEAVVSEGKLIGWSVVAVYSELVGGVKAIAYCAKEGGAVQATGVVPARRSRDEVIKQAIERRQHRQ